MRHAHAFRNARWLNKMAFHPVPIVGGAGVTAIGQVGDLPALRANQAYIRIRIVFVADKPEREPFTVWRP